MKPPQHITVVSDESQLVFIKMERTSRKNPEMLYVYQYTVSRTKLNQLLTLTEKELSEMIRKNIIV